MPYTDHAVLTDGFRRIGKYGTEGLMDEEVAVRLIGAWVLTVNFS